MIFIFVAVRGSHSGFHFCQRCAKLGRSSQPMMVFKGILFGEKVKRPPQWRKNGQLSESRWYIAAATAIMAFTVCIVRKFGFVYRRARSEPGVCTVGESQWAKIWKELEKLKFVNMKVSSFPALFKLKFLWYSILFGGFSADLDSCFRYDQVVIATRISWVVQEIAWETDSNRW